MKYAKGSLKLKFNKDCAKLNIIPKYIKFRFNLRNKTTSRIHHKIEKLWEKEEIKSDYKTGDNINLYIKLVRDELRYILCNKTYDSLEFPNKTQVGEIPIEKYNKLEKKISMLINKQTNSHNISETKFSNIEFYPRFIRLSETEFTKK